MALTGLVGKTTLAVHLFLRKLQDAAYIAVESINSTAEDLGITIRKYAGSQYHEIYRDLLLTLSFIVDLGASNIEAFLQGLVAHAGSHLDLGTLIIPITSGVKEQAEARKLVELLHDLGVDASRIIMVFNKVVGNVKEEFSQFLGWAEKVQFCVADPRICVRQTDLFDKLAARRQPLAAIIDDTEDYRATLNSALLRGDQDIALKAAKSVALRSLAVGVAAELDHVFELIKEYAYVG